MRKRYLDLEDFMDFLKNIEENNPRTIFLEFIEDGSLEQSVFLKMKFNDSLIILYSHPDGEVDVIQDTPVSSLEEYAEEIYGDLILNGEYNMFIEE